MISKADPKLWASCGEMKLKLEPDEPGLGYEDFIMLSRLQNAEKKSNETASPVTWLDLAIDYSLSLEATIRGQKPEKLRITAHETAEALRRYCRESVAEHMPGIEEIASALMERKHLRKMYSIIGGK